MIPPLHVVTNDAVLARDDFLDRAREVAEAGERRLAFHVRGPGTDGRKIYELCAALREAVHRSRSLLLVNDRVDVALALGIGAHLGGRSLPPGEARALLGDGVVVGGSIHAAAAADGARGRGLDFLLVGTIFPTPSHPGRRGAGVQRIREVRARTEVPVVAIGGIDPSRVGPVMDAGADGVAVVTAVWGAEEPAEAVVELLRRIENPEGSGAEEVTA